MQLTPKGTRTLTLARNGGTASLGAIMGRGPAGQDGANVLPTDTAVANAINNTASQTRTALTGTFVTFVRSDTGAPLTSGHVKITVDPTTHDIIDIIWEA